MRLKFCKKDIVTFAFVVILTAVNFVCTGFVELILLLLHVLFAVAEINTLQHTIKHLSNVSNVNSILKKKSCYSQNN